MANTRQSAKRARRNVTQRTVNQRVRSATKTAVKGAVDALKAKDIGIAKEAYMNAIRNLSRAASRGGIPARRASRKISRLTILAQKLLPESLGGTKN